MSSQFVPPQVSFVAWSSPRAQTADYWVQVGNPVASIGAGGQASFSFQLVPRGYRGSVQLQMDGLTQMSGAVAHLSSSATLVPGTIQMVLNTGASTTPGAYPVTLIATNGTTTHTVTVFVTVR